MGSWVVQLRKGLVELAVLASLQEGEAYGYQILHQLDLLEGLATSESTVYPILARLANEGLVKVRAAPSPAGPPRRYYHLTPLGKTRLKEMGGCWLEIRNAVDGLLNGAGGETVSKTKDERGHP